MRQAILALLALAGTSAFAAASPQSPNQTLPYQHGIWTHPGELMSLPKQGGAWNALLQEAKQPTGMPDLSDQDDDTDVRVLAKALVFARTGNRDLPPRGDRCLHAGDRHRGRRRDARARPQPGRLRARGRPREAAQRPRTSSSRPGSRPASRENLHGRTLQSTHEDRPNNWGTHAGASRAAVALYLRDAAEMSAAPRSSRAGSAIARPTPASSTASSTGRPIPRTRSASTPGGDQERLLDRRRAARRPAPRGRLLVAAAQGELRLGGAPGRARAGRHPAPRRVRRVVLGGPGAAARREMAPQAVQLPGERATTPGSRT